MTLVVNNLKFTYNQDDMVPAYAVDDVGFQVAQGEIVGLVGHTGSGKSTLAQLICGLIPADSGEIHLDDLQIVGVKKLKSIEIVKRIGMVFQYPEHQLFSETVLAELAYGPENLGWDFERIDSAIREVAQGFGMTEDFLQKNPFELSGGEKRKVTLGSVLVMHPKILVLDEPFVGLDCISKQSFTKLLLEWQEQNNTTIICISHDMDQLALFCQRLLVMNGGKLVLDQPIGEAFNRQDILEQAGILQPTCRQLLLELASAGWDISTQALCPADAATLIGTQLKGGGAIGK